MIATPNPHQRSVQSLTLICYIPLTLKTNVIKVFCTKLYRGFIWLISTGATTTASWISVQFDCYRFHDKVGCLHLQSTQWSLCLDAST
ncbi:hypothetical protein BJY04DRAFT_201638, partial [Aspergillus karnatakaensis]|uniref:uncharacterized protein n=1 Tax=Aspergillus karnatakaensis TaxID=1810916 RepID=UPI003CCD29AA